MATYELSDEAVVVVVGSGAGGGTLANDDSSAGAAFSVKNFDAPQIQLALNADKIDFDKVVIYYGDTAQDMPLYLSGDMDFLLSKPLPIRAVFVSKLLEAILPNLALMAAFVLPILFGQGAASGYYVFYYPLVVLVLIALALGCIVLGLAPCACPENDATGRREFEIHHQPPSSPGKTLVYLVTVRGSAIMSTTASPACLRGRPPVRRASGCIRHP